jgi:hypothetical protein
MPSKPKTYKVVIQGFGVTDTRFIEATSEKDAIEQASAQAGMTVTAAVAEPPEE